MWTWPVYKIRLLNFVLIAIMSLLSHTYSAKLKKAVIKQRQDIHPIRYQFTAYIIGAILLIFALYLGFCMFSKKPTASTPISPKVVEPQPPIKTPVLQVSSYFSKQAYSATLSKINSRLIGLKGPHNIHLTKGLCCMQERQIARIYGQITRLQSAHLANDKNKLEAIQYLQAVKARLAQIEALCGKQLKLEINGDLRLRELLVERRAQFRLQAQAINSKLNAYKIG